MARNEEKANSMLNRFLQMKKDDAQKPKMKRPYLASLCRDLNDADKWRQQILREIGKKVTEIQNAGLGEGRLRDLNDEINKLIREKGHWERRIVELGGPDYSRRGPKIIEDVDGNQYEVSGRGPGYRYFGAAKNLPGVRELFHKPPEKKQRRTRYDMFKSIDADYYGFRDEEDGVLVKVEVDAEKKLIAQAVARWEEEQRERAQAKQHVTSGDVVNVEPSAVESLVEFMDEDATTPGLVSEVEEAPARRAFVAHVPLPDQKDIEQMELLSKYASDEVIAEQQEAKDMLNIKR
eukprot:jgi/Chlat1/8988/Chrsp94S08339